MSMPHICTIEHENSKSYLPYSEEDRNPFHRCWRRTRNWTMVWKGHPLFPIYYESTATYLAERKRHSKVKYKLVIHPLSSLWFWCEMILIVTYLIAFAYFPLFNSVKRNETTQAERVMAIMAEGILLVEVFVRFFLGRLDRIHREVHMEPSFVARSYFLSFSFVADVLGAIPIELAGGYSVILFPYSMLRCAKFWRLSTLLEYFSDLLSKIQLKSAKASFSYFFITIYVFHWANCFFYSVTEIRPAFMGYYHDKSVAASFKTPGTATEQYIQMGFRTMGLMLSAKPCIQYKGPVEEKVASVVLQVLGKISILILAVVFITQILRWFELDSDYRAILCQLSDYMTQKKIPLPTRERVFSFYDYKFQGKFVKEARINSLLSDRLKKEINFHTSHKLLKKVAMFEDIPTNIVSEILSYLKVEVFLPNDIIIKAGAIAESMYFLSSGTVAVTTSSGKEVCHLQDGAYFGEAALILNHKKSISNVTALEICETYRLDAKPFRSCFKNHGDVLAKLRKEAELREDQTKKLEAEFQEKLFLKTYVGRRRSSLTTIRSSEDKLELIDI